MLHMDNLKKKRSKFVVLRRQKLHKDSEISHVGVFETSDVARGPTTNKSYLRRSQILHNDINISKLEFV